MRKILEEVVVGFGDEVIIINSIPKVNCTYQPDKDIKVATTFTSPDKKQKPF